MNMIRIGVTLALLATFATVGCSSDTTEEPGTETSEQEAEVSTVDIVVPNVVGLPLDEARTALEAAGITKITEIDIRENKSVLIASNWVVVEQNGDVTGVILGVEKFSDEASVRADGPEASAKFEQALKDVFGVQSFSELLYDASMWGGYINGVRVENGHAYITLQIGSDDPGSDELGSRAASAISTVLPAEAYEGITWIVVEDVAGVVIAQEQPAPIV